MDRPSTLWSSSTPDQRMFEYTTGDDRQWDARLMRWDVLGSLGHIEGLRAARLITTAEYNRMRRGLREILQATVRGGLQLDQRHEDVHTAVEYWLTSRAPGAGERLHTGRSRNDQVACDLRLFLKNELLNVQAAALRL
ncbi:MAG TPA: lyase family protein, partial [Gemmatimonadales bacterium]